MKKLLIALAAGIIAAAPLPVMAAEGKDAPDLATMVATASEASVGVIAGVGLGIPVASVRSIVEKTSDFRDKISQGLPDTGSPANLAYSTLFALPAGLVAGIIDGPYYGCKNAFNSGIDHPFSAESFSLGDDRITP